MANILVGGVNLKTLGMHGGVANAKNYGALSNDTYDNAGVVQALIDAWEALDGGTIVFPASQEGARYRFTGGVINDSINAVNFLGTGASPRPHDEGGNASVLWLDSDTDDAAIITYASASSTGGQIVERLTLMGNNDSDGLGVNQSGILFSGRCHNHQIRECGFRYFSGYAVAHDSTSATSYNQNSSMRNSHFWGVGGIFGPTEEYADGAQYLFSTLYTFDNIGLDHRVLWLGSGHTPKPYLIDIRATRSASFLGQLLIEGAGAAGQTACIALASNGAYLFDQIWYEIVSDAPTYLMAFYGTQTNKYLATGEKNVRVRKCGGLPLWFQDHSSNETTVKVEIWDDFAADAIGDIAVWENGIGVNTSGYVEIGLVNSAGSWKLPDTYLGRVKIGSSGMNHQSRVPKNQSARCLFKWNADKGSLYQDFGEVSVVSQGHTASHAIEADGNFLVHRVSGGTTNNFPEIQVIIRGDNYEGAVACLLMRYRLTVDAGDAGDTGEIITSGFNQAEIYNDAIADRLLSDSSVYQTVTVSGILLAADNDPNRYVYIRKNSSFAQPAVLRIAAMEVWLGIPESFDLSLAVARTVPTFTASDTTPSVAGFKTWKTDTGGLTITDLDDFPAGEERTIISKGAVVFDTTGTNLVGSSVDITTASGDITRWVSEDGTTKRLIAFVDVSVDNSAGA